MEGETLVAKLGTTTHLSPLLRCGPVVRYVAEAGRHYEPENLFWVRLLSLLPRTPPPKSSVVPHPTRFVREEPDRQPFAFSPVVGARNPRAGARPVG
jgi:hypothetical protein